jgi:hypothetical protein
MYKIIQIDFKLFVQEKHVHDHWVNLMKKKSYQIFEGLKF